MKTKFKVLLAFAALAAMVALLWWFYLEKRAHSSLQSHGAAEKPVTALTESETAIVRQICRDTLKGFLNRDVLEWTERTLYYMPDDDGHVSEARLEKLNPPVSRLPAVVTRGIAANPSILKSALKEQVTSRVAASGGRQFQILDASVFVEEQKGNGAVENQSYNVMIFPRRIRIE